MALSAFHFSSGSTSPSPELLALRSDGPLVVFDRDLTMLNYSDDPSSPRSTLRFGGYYSGSGYVGHTPVVGRTESSGEPAPILVRKSQGSLVRLDPTHATITNPPAVVWERLSGWYPTICDVDADGQSEVLHWSRTSTFPQRDAVSAARMSSGATLWSRPLTDATSAARNDLLCADIDPLPGDDVFYQVFTSSYEEQAGTLRGTDGTDWWPSRHARGIGGYASFPKALADVDRDGRLDLVGSFARAQVLSGADGSVLLDAATASSYFFPLVQLADATSPPTVLFHGGHQPNRLLRLSDLSVAWTDAPGPYTGAFGTVVSCDAADRRFVAGAYASPRLRIVDAATGALQREIWLGDGALYPSEADLPAAVSRSAVLGTTTAVQDLLGDGRPGVLVGSTDGWLYAVDPCAGTLFWSLELGAPVGEPVVADVDGDAHNDILVTVADGYLYLIAREVTPAPEYVWDTDPPAGFPGEDRDTIETHDTLYARWSAVPGATSYQYVVIGPGDAILTPGFVDVGSATTATATGLPLQVGQVYSFGVRAVGPRGPSAETLSDGIEVVDHTPPSLSLTATPRPFSPDGDGIDDAVRITAAMRDDRGLDGWSLAILAEDRLELRRFEPLDATGTFDERFVDWDGLDPAGVAAPEGIYRAVALVRDLGGNQTSAEITLELELDGAGDAGTDAADTGADSEDDAGVGDGAPTDSLHDVSAGDLLGDFIPDVPEFLNEADTEAPETAWSGGGGGCGCATARAAATSPLPLLCLLLNLALRRRRSR